MDSIETYTVYIYKLFLLCVAIVLQSVIERISSMPQARIQRLTQMNETHISNLCASHRNEVTASSLFSLVSPQGYRLE